MELYREDVKADLIQLIQDKTGPVTFGEHETVDKIMELLDKLNIYSLAPVQNLQVNTPKKKVYKTEPCQQEECKMNYATTAVSVSADLDHTKSQRKFLSNSLYEAFTGKKYALKKKFGLTYDEAPRSFEELLARIQAGKYVIDDKDTKKKTYDPLAYIVWRDPSVKEDQDGYDAAKAELRKAYDKAEEDIRILAPEAGLASLRAFKDISVQ